MMLANVLWLLPLVWGAGSAAFGGPPLAFEQRPTVSEALRFPLPGKQFLRMPSTRLEAVASPRWQLVDQIRPLSVQDLEKLSDQQRPPLEFTLPVEFREYKPPANRLEGTVETVGVPVVEGVVTNPPRRGLVGWLPQRVQSWIPTLPSLSSLFPRIPDYLPGFDFEAEVHRKPTKLPHIPTPSELLKEVSNLVDSAIHRLHRKQEQLFELVKCSCPRPARCDAIFQEFLTIGGSVSGSVSGAASLGAAAPSKVEDAGSPSVSLYTGLVSPGGSEGPGVGFYVDRSGPHLGHYHHGPHPSVASAPVVVPQPATVLVSKVGAAADHVASLASPAGLSLPGKLSSPSELKAP